MVSGHTKVALAHALRPNRSEALQKVPLTFAAARVAARNASISWCHASLVCPCCGPQYGIEAEGAGVGDPATTGGCATRTPPHTAGAGAIMATAAATATATRVARRCITCPSEQLLAQPSEGSLAPL